MTPDNPLTSQMAEPQQATPAFSPFVEDQSKPIGDNFENLSKNLQLWLWKLLLDQERQDEICRRNEVVGIVQRKLYYRGEQYWWYGESTGVWNPPNVLPAGQSEDDNTQPAFQNVTNIYRAFSESLQSVLSQNNTAARFWPESASDPNDIQTAKMASKVVDIIHRQNDWQNLIDVATYYMSTDGFLGSYVRHETSAELYGEDEMTVLGLKDVPAGPPTVQCPCGFQNEGTTETQPVCPECGQETQDIPAPMAQVPEPIGTVGIPKGQQVISIIPALNLRRTMYANEQKDFLYMEWIYDVHKARAMSQFPWAAEKIQTSGGSYGTGSILNGYEQLMRRILYLGAGRYGSTGIYWQDLGEMRRAWLRPCVFELVTDANVKQLLKTLYPKGLYVAFYNDVYCESRSECMDEYWETMQACDGEGQVRPTITSSIITLQDQLNDAGNLIFEQAMNGVAEAFGDQNCIDFEARSEQVAAPGNMTPVDLKPGESIDQKIKFANAVEPAVALVNYFKFLFSEGPQFLTGVFPALFGGDTGSNDTASGIAAQRNQALGRVGRAWRRLQIFCANTDGKAVNCFQKNMTDDVEVAKQGDSGEFESDWIRVSDMQGKVVAYPEVDAQYPTLQSDVRAILLNFMNNANPLFMAVAQEPGNMEYLFREIGTPDLEVPGEDQRIKTYTDIQQLMQEQPSTVASPDGQQHQIPSIVPDPLIDNLPVALATVKQWLISQAGQEAKQSNPAGYQNVYAFAKAIDQLQKQAAFQNAVVTQAMAGNGPGADLAGSEHISAPPSNNPNEPEPPSSSSSGPSAKGPSASQA